MKLSSALRGLALIAVACTSHAASQSLHAQTSDPDGHATSSYDEAGDAAAIAASSGRARRNGQVLRLMARERVVEFENLEHCEAYAQECRYTLVRHDSRAGAFVILVGLIEDFRVLWVDDVTGAATDVGAEPHISPDGARFAVARTSECCGGSYSGIQVRRTAGAVLEFEQGSEINGSYAYFEFVRWLSNDAFLIATQRWLPGRDGNSEEWIAGRTIVERRPEGWTLRWIAEPVAEK